MRIVADPTDPTQPEDVEHLVAEVRDFLLSDGQIIIPLEFDEKH